jgi:uncharacterized protein
MGRGYAYAAVFGILFLAVAASASAASFDCDRVGTDQVTESTICSNTSLSRLDDQITALYRDARNKFVNGGETFDSVRDDQRAWLRKRGACGGDVVCLQSAYEQRAAALQSFAAPQSGEGAPASTEAAATPEQATPSPAPEAVPANDASAGPTAEEVTSSIKEDRPLTAKEIQNNTEIVANQSESSAGYVVGIGLLLLLAICIYMLPTIFAFARGHGYKWIIFAVNLFSGWTGLIWVAAFVWAIWPREKSLIDPVVGNTTGMGTRNAGDALGAVHYGKERGYRAEARADHQAIGDLSSSTLERLEKLAELRSKGVLTDAEFEREKLKTMSV